MDPSHWGAIHSCLNLLRNPTAIEYPTDLTDLTTNVRLVVVPLANPDGYDYTINQDRLYQKNMQKNDDSICRGVHLDSNFDYQWDQERGELKNNKKVIRHANIFGTIAERYA